MSEGGEASGHKGGWREGEEAVREVRGRWEGGKMKGGEDLT